MVVEDDLLYVHANACMLGDWGYVRSEIEAETSLCVMVVQITFCGHTHVPALYHMPPMRPPVAFAPPPGKPVPLSRSRRWLAVLGVVGQPARRKPRRVLRNLQSAPPELAIIRVPRRRRAAAAKIRAAGLPESLVVCWVMGLWTASDLTASDRMLEF